MDKLTLLVDVRILSDKIKQLEADSGNWEAAYKTCAKSEDKLIEENQRLTEAIEFVDNWCKAYPIKIFPEPDMKKAHQALKEHGMTLDAISTSNMRHVITRVREKFQKALEGL